MEKTRSVPESRRHLLGGPHRASDGVQLLLVLLVHLHVGVDGEVVAGFETAEVGPQIFSEILRLGRRCDGVSIASVGEQAQIAVGEKRRFRR